RYPLSSPQKSSQCPGGRHAAGETETARTVFQGGNLLFEYGAGRVAAARVVVRAECSSLRLLEGCGLVDGRGHGPKWISRSDVKTNQTAGKFHDLQSSFPRSRRSRHRALAAGRRSNLPPLPIPPTAAPGHQ